MRPRVVKQGCNDTAVVPRALGMLREMQHQDAANVSRLVLFLGAFRLSLRLRYSTYK